MELKLFLPRSPWGGSKKKKKKKKYGDKLEEDAAAAVVEVVIAHHSTAERGPSRPGYGGTAASTSCPCPTGLGGD